ncbi:hypothetical protein K493DRAFT_320699 [Basidiobolus meristosporus CBS 931.73]|uniref:Camp-independent regulatory protein pac2 n=1 Tax=Basidiobolus meristosporus CBS 931.73 TaxID=1314790 RepID=A0A1Y1X689_9FUNG|nr:hypothetical protein K493DRAFT_320699 [Basidiobolus meristosporus CBS 931.73]|eukprot:ORX81307.1 hypothetical protein K493DRAFT_320699 [Basidiobolus meristosporus CBS 931.73]
MSLPHLYQMETYFGYIETVHDALLVLEACRLGKLNRVRRRLTDKERRSIRSGSVYVWEEEESGIRRWTDGYNWSPSRVFGSFLTYRELQSRHRITNVKIPSPSLSNSESELEDSCHRTACGHSDLPIKTDGLIKQSISVTTVNHRKFHLISYYNKDHVASGLLKVPSFDLSLAHTRIMKDLYPDIPSDLFHTNEFANSFESCKPVVSSQMPSSNRTARKTPSPFRNSPSHIQLEYPRRFDEDSYLQQAAWNMKLPSVNSHHLAINQLPPLILPFQDIRLDKLPCSEDRRQLYILSTALSW